MSQTVVTGKDVLEKLKKLLWNLNCRKYLLVCDSSFPYLGVEERLSDLGIPYVKFDGFTSNPLYEDVCKGVRLFNDEHCDAIIAIGGGSTIDVAKCIKLYCKMDSKKNYLMQEYADTGVPLIAVPTTAGTGSESTRYAVIYFEGKKQSVTHDSIVPNYAVLEPNFLKTLPLYQKKCTVLDALCQGIESWWSVNSNEESKQYSRFAVETIVRHMDAYLENSQGEASEQIMLAANYAGRAINITQTTAPHAMSYKLTSLYGLPHGHAVAVCLPPVWRYTQAHLEHCVDPRGEAYLRTTLSELPIDPDQFKEILQRLGIHCPESEDREREIALLTQSVNTTRLKNHPVSLTDDVIKGIYERIVR